MHSTITRSSYLFSGPPPPPPPPSNIILTSPTHSAASTVGRTFGQSLKHQFDAVNRQVEHGLLHVKRTCVFVDTILKSLEHSSDAVKLTSELSQRWKDDEPLQDVMAQYVYAGGMIGEVMLQTYNAHEKFRRSAQVDRDWLYAFYKSAQARRRELTKDHTRMLGTWNSVEESLIKERRDCQKAYSELRLAQDAKDKEEVAETSKADLYPKLVKKWKSQKEVVVKKFQSYEKAYEKAQALQLSNDTVSLPSMLSELESIERDRLAHLTEYMTKFQSLMLTWSNELKSNSDLVTTIVPALSVDKSMTSMLDKFCTSFGPPPKMIPIRFDLPCTSQSVANDTLPPDSAPALAYIGATANGSSSTVLPASTSATSPSHATRNGPMPPPIPQPTQHHQPQQQQVRTTPAPLPRAAMPVAAVRPLANASTAVASPPPPPPPSSSSSSSTQSTSSPARAQPPPPPPHTNNSPSPVTTTTSPPRPAPPTVATSSTTTPAKPLPLAAAPPPNASSTSTTIAAPKALPVLGVFKSRAPAPTLPQKRKPKIGGEADPDPSLLPPPPLPPVPVNRDTPSFRASITHRRSSVAQPPPPSAMAKPPLPPMPTNTTQSSTEPAPTAATLSSSTTSSSTPLTVVHDVDIDSSLAFPSRSTGRMSIFGVSHDEVNNVPSRLSTASRGPPPLPPGTRTSVTGPPPIPQQYNNAMQRATLALEQEEPQQLHHEQYATASHCEPVIESQSDSFELVEPVDSVPSPEPSYQQAPAMGSSQSQATFYVDDTQATYVDDFGSNDTPSIESDVNAMTASENVPQGEASQYDPQQAQQAVALYDFQLDEDTPSVMRRFR